MHKLKEEDSLEGFLEDCEVDVEFRAECRDFWALTNGVAGFDFGEDTISLYIYIYIYILNPSYFYLMR